jgi:hypothetical protein
MSDPSASNELPPRPPVAESAAALLDLVVRQLSTARDNIGRGGNVGGETTTELFCTAIYVSAGWHDVCPLLYYHSD